MYITGAKHFIIDFWEVKNFLYYKETKILVSRIKAILKLLDNTYLEHQIHRFENNSYSASFLISESHLSLHTWPEYNYIGFDFYTCNKSIDTDKTIELLKELFGSPKMNIMVIDRGESKFNVKHIKK